jgi:hypothetical protein
MDEEEKNVEDECAQKRSRDDSAFVLREMIGDAFPEALSHSMCESLLDEASGDVERAMDLYLGDPDAVKENLLTLVQENKRPHLPEPECGLEANSEIAVKKNDVEGKPEGENLLPFQAAIDTSFAFAVPTKPEKNPSCSFIIKEAFAEPSILHCDSADGSKMQKDFAPPQSLRNEQLFQNEAEEEEKLFLMLKDGSVVGSNRKVLLSASRTLMLMSEDVDLSQNSASNPLLLPGVSKRVWGIIDPLLAMSLPEVSGALGQVQPLSELVEVVKALSYLDMKSLGTLVTEFLAEQGKKKKCCFFFKFCFFKLCFFEKVSLL